MVQSNATSNPPVNTDPNPGWYFLLVVVAMVGSLSIAFFVKGGIGEMNRLREQKQQLVENNQKQRERIRKLKRREKRLHQDPHLIENIAREKLGLAKPGEKQVGFKFLGSDTIVKTDSDSRIPSATDRYDTSDKF